MEESTIELSRDAYDLANTLLAQGAYRRPIVWTTTSKKALPELVRKNAAKVHGATPDSVERIEMLVTEIDFTLV